MDISGVNEDWEHQVTPLLHDMTNCDDDYFNPHELLAGSVTGGTGGNNGQTASGAQSGVGSSAIAVNPTTAISAQSPISGGGGGGGGNPPSLSPGGVSASGVPTGALSPGSISQTSQNAPPTSTTSSCCENGRPIMTDPVSGQTVCSCQYDSARLALSSYSRIPTAGVGVYGTPYPSTEQNPYPSIGVDSSAFYSPLSNPYALKDSGPTSDMSAWTSAGLQPTTGYYPYDPTLAAYGYGAGYDLAARRKNATRESTATLKAWLNDHKKNPYPTKGEKIMLAIITKMTLTQVSTWFANARRRLKKENKMTWEPKNKTDDDDDAMVSDDDKEKDDMDHHHHHHHMDKTRDHKDSLHHVKSEHDKDEEDDDLTDDDRKPDGMHGQHHLHASIPNHLQQYHPAYSHHHHHPAMLGGYGHPHGHHHSGLIKEEMNLLSGSKNQSSSDCGIPIPATKPKIWSLADTAACKTPPPTHHGAWMTGGGGGNGSGPGGGNYQQAHHNPTGHHHQSTGMIGMMMGGGNGNSGATTPTNHMNTTSMMNTNPHHQHQSMTTTGMNTTGSAPMMNPHHQFTNSPYARYGGFLTGPHHYQTSQTPNAVTGPIHQQQQQQQQLLQQQQQQHPGSTTPTLSQQTAAQQQSNQQTNANTNSNQSMGFPEVQTDTPPQTPPNMKLPSVAGNLISTATPNQINTINNNNNNNHNNNTAGTPPNPTTGTCYNNNNNNNNTTTNNNNINQTTNGYGSSSSSPVSAIQTNATYLGNFTTTNSPQKLAQEYLMSSGIVNHHNQNGHLQDGSTAFKPFYKSPQQITNGFVSPV